MIQITFKSNFERADHTTLNFFLDENLLNVSGINSYFEVTGYFYL